MTNRVALWELFVGLGLGILFGILGYRRRLLSRSAVFLIGATLTLVFGGAGWEWGTLLAIVLLTCGLWTAYRTEIKDELLGHSRGPYGVTQVLARVGWPLALASVRMLSTQSTVLFAAYVGSLAAALADIWSTEIGVLSDDPPRLITTGRKVTAGTAGGISVLGVVAAVGGTWLIGFVALGVQVLSAWLDMKGLPRALLWLPLGVTLSGVAASLVDSLLGATAQAMYYCPQCHERTEDPVHHCGAKTERVRGIPWLSNSVIDFVISLVGAALGAMLAGCLAP